LPGWKWRARGRAFQPSANAKSDERKIRNIRAEVGALFRALPASSLQHKFMRVGGNGRKNRGKPMTANARACATGRRRPKS